ncbi:MAG: hypothetical protein Q4B28_06245 [bacterium]|nr:hypothetical protein [bacterium]
METSIPQDDYHQALLTFLKTKFTDSAELDLRTLATQIANENGNGSLYEKYSKLRNNSPEKQQLLEQQRNTLQKEVKKQAGEIAITTIKSSLKQMGVPIDEGNFVPDAR